MSEVPLYPTPPSEDNAKLSPRVRARQRVFHRIRGYLEQELADLPADAPAKDRTKIGEELAAVGLAIAFIKRYPELLEEILDERKAQHEARRERYATER